MNPRNYEDSDYGLDLDFANHLEPNCVFHILGKVG